MNITAFIPTQTIGCLAMAVAGLLAISPLAQGETYADEASADSYYAYIRGMPDLDQHRDPATWDAARNIGKMYCGATTVANVPATCITKDSRTSMYPISTSNPLTSAP